MHCPYDLNHVSRKQRKEVATNLKAIYSAPSFEEAEYYLEQVEGKWNSSRPRIGKSRRNDWERIAPLFWCSQEIRKAIYTTNAIEPVNMALRKVTKNRGSFPNDESMFKLMCLALQNLQEMDNADPQLAIGIKSAFDYI